MTTLELKTSIVADLDQMSVEMLKNVSHYVKKLRQRPRSASVRPDAQSRRDAAMQFVKTLSVQGEHPVSTAIHAAVNTKFFISNTF